MGDDFRKYRKYQRYIEKEDKGDNLTVGYGEFERRQIEKIHDKYLCSRCNDVIALYFNVDSKLCGHCKIAEDLDKKKNTF